ncbi:MAG: DUF2254 domain-containing protein [Nakamurella sp.]
MSRSPGSVRLSTMRDAVRTQLWPVPIVGVAVAVVLGIGLPLLDENVDDVLPGWLTAYLFGGGAGAARDVLGAIAGSLITVTSLTFSLTVVTLQLASSQFSPRLLRTFSSDRFVQSTLALFLGTFTFALTVLRTVRTESEGGAAFVPEISVTTAFALTIASVVGLVLFLAHLAREIRVETMLRNVHRDATATVRRVLAERTTDVAALPQPPTEPGLLVHLNAASSGFLISVDERELLAAATDADAVLLIARAPGSSLIEGTPMGVGWPRGPRQFDEHTQSRLQDAVARSISTGVERTAAQDAEFGLRQLTDVTTKALSPGINDPTTAIHALGHSSALLCEMVGRDLGPRVLRDEDDVIRVVLRRPSFEELLDLAVEQPRRYGAADAQVLGRIGWLLRELGWRVDLDVDRHVVERQLARLRHTVAGQDFDATERATLTALTDDVDDAIAGRWSSQ